MRGLWRAAAGRVETIPVEVELIAVTIEPGTVRAALVRVNPPEMRAPSAGEGPFFIVIESSSLRLFGDVCSRLLFTFKWRAVKGRPQRFWHAPNVSSFVLCLFCSNL